MATAPLSHQTTWPPPVSVSLCGRVSGLLKDHPPREISVSSSPPPSSSIKSSDQGHEKILDFVLESSPRKMTFISWGCHGIPGDSSQRTLNPKLRTCIRHLLLRFAGLWLRSVIIMLHWLLAGSEHSIIFKNYINYLLEFFLNFLWLYLPLFLLVWKLKFCLFLQNYLL